VTSHKSVPGWKKVEVKALAALVNEHDRLIGRRGGRPPP
jgi:hypothetical protein